jgi:rRNA biogenesis protein RRP5
LTNLNDIFFVGKSVNVRITEVDQSQGKIVASIKQALPTALAAAALDIGSSVAGLVSQIHKEQVVVTLIPSQLTALISLSNLSNHRHMGVEELRSSLKVGEHLDDLIIVSKNATSGLYIVSNKRNESAATTKVSKAEKTKVADTTNYLKQGEVVSGRVVSHSIQGTIIQLSPTTRGRVHPCDISDDLSAFASGNNPLIEGNTTKCYILKTARSAKLCDLSTRPSRTDPGSSEVVDKEINEIKDVTSGESVRGLIKNVGDHGVFVSLGRNVTARIMIRELFDEFVKDWKAKFEVNQLVEGKILR